MLVSCLVLFRTATLWGLAQLALTPQLSFSIWPEVDTT